MHVPSRGALLGELDRLGHGARMARVGRLARDAKGTPGLEALMTELERGDAYEVCLGLELARSAGDEARLLRGLHHPSLLVRCRAATYVPRLVRDDAAIERDLPRLPPDTRTRVLSGIARARRQALAVRLFPRVLARHGAIEARLLLSALDAPTLAGALQELGHRVLAWDRLVDQHPEVVLRYIQSRLADAPERERAVLFERFGPAIARLALRHSAEVLALALELAPSDDIPSSIRARLRLLTRRHPEQVFALITRPSFRAQLLAEGVPHGASRELRAFTPAQRLTLARIMAPAPHHLVPLMNALAPSERGELFTRVQEGVPAVLPEPLLGVLPHAVRDAQAARQLTLREVQEDRVRSLAVLAYRAIEHARGPLTRAASSARAEDRAYALSLLVRCTGLSRRGMTETLAQLSRLKNDQDPVRMHVIEALAQAPISVFQPEHAPALAELTRWVVEARDTSNATRSALQRVAFRLLRAHAAAPDGPLFQLALQIVKELAHQSDGVLLPRLDTLPRGVEVHLVSALLGQLRAAAARESHNLLLALADALGRRGWNVDFLHPLLEPVTETPIEWQARTAIARWLAPPRPRDTRVRRLLDRDETTITVPSIFEHLHRRRQEWLDPFLDGHPLRGRFLSGKVVYLLPARDGFHRWLPRQQRGFASLLHLVAADPGHTTWERAQALRILPRLHVVQADELLPFIEDGDVALAEAALTALAWLDRPETALPLLLKHLDSDRARVAMYALPRVARRVPGEVLLSALESLLSRERLKVTVHKEVVRLLGTIRSEQGLALLRREAERPGLHRDVRIAVGHAARQLLDLDEAWSLLEGLARSPEPDVARSLLEQDPAALAPEARPRYLELLLQSARHPDLEIRRIAFRRLPAWSVGNEERVARLAAERLLDLTGGAEWRDATDALVGVVRDGRAGEHVVSAAARLMAASPPGLDLTTDRDLPGRQRLMGLCDALLRLPRAVRLRCRGLLLEVSRTIGSDPSLWPLTARLRLATVDWQDAGAAAELVSRLAREAREEPLFAVDLATTVRESLDAGAAEWTPEGLLQAADRLFDEAPLVSVPFVAAAGERMRWSEEATRRLRALREHPRPAVRAAAKAVLTSVE